MNFTVPALVTRGDTTLVSPTLPGMRLGQLATTRDGRRFRLARAGALQVLGGRLQCAPAPIATLLNMTVAAAPVGARTLTVTPTGATTAAANAFQGGLAIVSAGAAFGQVFSVRGHGPISGVTPFTIAIEPEEWVLIALSASSRIDLIASPYDGVVVSPGAALVSAPIGVPLVPIPAGQYGWLQVGGLAPVLMDGPLGPGAAVTASTAVPGAVAVAAAGAPVVGRLVVPGVDGRETAVLLTLE